MPTISIYLGKELYEIVKDDPSKIVREALEEKFKEKE